MLLVTGESGEHIVLPCGVGRVLLKLGSAITRYIYVACYIIASTLRVGFLASFSSVSKYCTSLTGTFVMKLTLS
jgi:hypothetical protein